MGAVGKLRRFSLMALGRAMPSKWAASASGLGAVEDGGLADAAAKAFQAADPLRIAALCDRAGAAPEREGVPRPAALVAGEISEILDGERAWGVAADAAAALGSFAGALILAKAAKWAILHRAKLRMSPWKMSRDGKQPIDLKSSEERERDRSGLVADVGLMTDALCRAWARLDLAAAGRPSGEAEREARALAAHESVEGMGAALLRIPEDAASKGAKEPWAGMVEAHMGALDALPAADWAAIMAARAEPFEIAGRGPSPGGEFGAWLEAQDIVFAMRSSPARVPSRPRRM